MLGSRRSKNVCIVCNGTGLKSKRNKASKAKTNPADLCPNCVGSGRISINPADTPKSQRLSKNAVVGLSVLGVASITAIAILLTRDKGSSVEKATDKELPAKDSPEDKEDVTPTPKETFEPGKVYTLGKSKIEMIACPEGTFNMGHAGFKRNPPRVEKINKPFLLGKTEVTQELYKKVIGTNSSNDTNDEQNPVDSVSWEDAVKFCNKLSELDGLALCYTKNSAADFGWSCDFSKNGYRLPTIKEWEYAAKAGTENKWSGTDDESKLAEYAWYSENSDLKVHPVGKLKPNEWGFYDMAGNLYEWCWDTYKDVDAGIVQKCCMGGMYLDDAHACKSSNVGAATPIADIDTTFRICRTIL
jgi:formylglycine-generating enzyme required for sulfatase activity